MTIGCDCGTYNLVVCHRDKENNFVYKREVNAFIEIPLEDQFLFNIMKSATWEENGKKRSVPLIEREKVAYCLGEAAIKMAYTMSQVELRRPMAGGCVNPKERDAFQIMNIMIHSLLDCVKQDKEILYYSIPSNAINEETDADYHSKILEAIFKAFKSPEGFKVDARPINEALALVYAELEKKAFTGIGASFGAGMVNLCFAMYGQPVYKFAIVNSGDWIDKMAAKATGESVAFINKEKTKVDLGATPTTMVERAIQTQYRLMIEHTINEIKKGLQNLQKTVRSDEPIDFVLSGGTASPTGFLTLFKEVLSTAALPIKVGEVIRPKDPLYSVARGCLLAAENAVK